MHKAIFIFLLVGSCSSAMAGWIANGRNSVVTQYADSTTIHKADGKVRMADLQDFSSPQLVSKVTEYKFLSATNQQEYDCIERQSRFLSYTWFDKHMGKGKVVSKERISPLLEWQKIVHGSANEILWKLACH